MSECADGLANARPAVRPDLAALDGYHSPQLDVEVRLNTNESPLELPPEFTVALADELDGIAWNRYPDRGAVALREAIAATHPGVGPEQVFVANGSNEVIQTLCLTFGGHGSTVATFEPTYAMYGQIARTTQCGLVEVERDAEYRVRVSSIDDLVAKRQPEMMFLCSPNNPTGTPEQPATIVHALEAATGVVVVDEAYGQFASFSALELLDHPAADQRLVIVRTFSKTWAMAGLRLGYCIAPSWMVTALEKAVLPYHLDIFKQVAGCQALRFSAAMEERVATVVTERERVGEGLARLGLKVWPSEANFVLFKTGGDGSTGAGSTSTGSTAADQLWQGLVDRSVLVRNCSGWPRLANCLRATIGTSDENDRLLQATAEVLAQ